MPLASLFHILPFLSTSSPPAPKTSPAIQHISPVPPKEKPALRICFPLRIQRGHDSWWEYEEFRIQFRDRLMWRQAFRLDEEDARQTSLDDAVDLSSLGESSKAGGNTAAHDGDDPAFKSHWSYSTSPFSSVLDRSLSNESTVSQTSSQRLMQLMTRLLSATSTSQSDKSSASTREVSQHFTPPPSSNHCTEQHHPLRPLPLNLPSRQMHSPPESSAREGTETDEIQHHRNIALGKLEGKSDAGTKCMGFSTFRNMFRTRKMSTTQVVSPVPPAEPPLRQKSRPQDQTIRISSEEWADLRDDIIGGIMGDEEGSFPFYTERQKAMIMPVEQNENCFRVQASPQREGIPMGGLKAVLEHIEARNWRDVIFVSYDDTPREMRWWYTTREPQVLQWGVNMI